MPYGPPPPLDFDRSRGNRKNTPGKVLPEFPPGFALPDKLSSAGVATYTRVLQHAVFTLSWSYYALSKCRSLVCELSQKLESTYM